MLKTLRMTVPVLLSCAFAVTAYAAPTKQDAQAIVEKAAAYAETNGPNKLVTEVNKKDGPFHQGELYVFVYDLNGKTLAHPVSPDLVGQNDVAKPDADGKFFRKDILAVAKEKGSGWVDYKWMNPNSGKVEPKVTYVKKQGELIIGAGVYTK